VLELEQVGIYDNFFELGGDPPQHSDYRQSQPSWFTGYTKQLFENPTVAGLAAVTGTANHPS